ncbi:MAG: DUF4397 domain-containing protein [Defluviitaleaceae bacterium]|nr:DUF4397 domain-containing protein [Defluviitaleaceae bacterium]
MIFAAQAGDGKERACYIRFFNGAAGAQTADIFVNDQLIVQDLAHGAFSPFRQAKSGAYRVEVRIDGGNTELDYSELLSLMEDMSYTVAMTGDAAHLGLAVVPLDLRRDIRRPNVRFANVVPYDTVLDVDINHRRAAEGLMYREVSNDIAIAADGHVVTVFDSYGRKVLEDGLQIQANHNYLGMIAGSMEDPENAPGLYVAEDMPLL